MGICCLRPPPAARASADNSLPGSMRLSGVSRARQIRRDSLTLASQSSNLHRAAIKSRPRDEETRERQAAPRSRDGRRARRVLFGARYARAGRSCSCSCSNEETRCRVPRRTQARHPGDGGSLRELGRALRLRARHLSRRLKRR